MGRKAFNPCQIATYEHAVSLGLGDVWREKFGGAIPEPSRSAPAPVAASPSRATDDGMNKTERAFWDRMREEYRPPHWLIYREGITLRLAGRTRYTPDFLSVCMLPGPGKVFACWEIKGFMRDDAAVKIKVAAELYPCIRFVLVTRVRRRWECRDVTARGISREIWCPVWLR